MGCWRVKETPFQAKLLFLPWHAPGGTEKLTFLHFKLGLPLAGSPVLQQKHKHMLGFFEQVFQNQLV